MLPRALNQIYISPLVNEMFRYLSYGPVNPVLRKKTCRFIYVLVYPGNKGRSSNVGSMLVHRLRRWPNIKPTLFKCLVFDGIV